jgi:hypothetical protein
MAARFLQKTNHFKSIVIPFGMLQKFCNKNYARVLSSAKQLYNPINPKLDSIY